MTLPQSALEQPRRPNHTTLSQLYGLTGGVVGRHRREAPLRIKRSPGGCSSHRTVLRNCGAVSRSRCLGERTRWTPWSIPVESVSVSTSREQVLELCGREVVITNPDKVVFPDAGHTKLDLVRYYLSVAEGALRGVAGRPMILKRFVKGIGEEAVFQKRAPATRPEWLEVAQLHYASGTSAAEIVVRDEAGLAWVVNLGCVDLNPHPVLAEDLEHPAELRIDLDPVPGVEWQQIVDVAFVARGSHRRGTLRMAEDVRLPRLPHLRPGRPGLDLPPAAVGGGGRGPRGGASRARAGDEPLVEGGTSRGVRRLQPERQGPHGGLGVLGAGHAGRAGVHAAALGRGAPGPP